MKSLCFGVLFVLFGLASSVAQAEIVVAITLSSPEALPTHLAEGPSALKLLESLPPVQTDEVELPGVASPEQLKKHFRALLLVAADGKSGVRIECSSAAWELTGHGRVSQFKLVQAIPTCSIVQQQSVNVEETSPASLQAALLAAVEANRILSAFSKPIPIRPCHARICP